MYVSSLKSCMKLVLGTWIKSSKAVTWDMSVASEKQLLIIIQVGVWHGGGTSMLLVLSDFVKL